MPEKFIAMQRHNSKLFYKFYLSIIDVYSDYTLFQTFLKKIFYFYQNWIKLFKKENMKKVNNKNNYV